MASHMVKSIYTAIQCGYMHTPNVVACTCIHINDIIASYIIWTTENINVGLVHPCMVIGWKVKRYN